MRPRIMSIVLTFVLTVPDNAWYKMLNGICLHTFLLIFERKNKGEGLRGIDWLPPECL